MLRMENSATDQALGPSHTAPVRQGAQRGRGVRLHPRPDDACFMIDLLVDVYIHIYTVYIYNKLLYMLIAVVLI